MFEGWRKTATKVERPADEVESEEAPTAEALITPEDDELIRRVMEADVVFTGAGLSVPKGPDDLKHPARTEAEMIADAEKGFNPHGFTELSSRPEVPLQPEHTETPLDKAA